MLGQRVYVTTPEPRGLAHSTSRHLLDHSLNEPFLLLIVTVVEGNPNRPPPRLQLDDLSLAAGYLRNPHSDCSDWPTLGPPATNLDLKKDSKKLPPTIPKTFQKLVGTRALETIQARTLISVHERL